MNNYTRIFRVTGANQNAQKLLSTDLVNANNSYSYENCALHVTTLHVMYVGARENNSHRVDFHDVFVIFFPGMECKSTNLPIYFIYNLHFVAIMKVVLLLLRKKIIFLIKSLSL